MGIAESLDARARAMRSVFEQTRQRLAHQKPKEKRRIIPSEPGWNTSVGPQAMRAIFEPIIEPVVQQKQSRSISNAERELLLLSQAAQPRVQDAPRRSGVVLKGRHADVINELIKAHRLF